MVMVVFIILFNVLKLITPTTVTEIDGDECKEELKETKQHDAYYNHRNEHTDDSRNNKRCIVYVIAANVLATAELDRK